MGKKKKSIQITLDESERGYKRLDYDVSDDEFDAFDEEEAADIDNIEGIHRLMQTPAGQFPYYEDYLTATKEQRKEERKRRKKLYPMDKETIKEIYEHLGSEKDVREIGESLRSYTDNITNLLILSKIPSEILCWCRNVIYQGTEDLMKGYPWILNEETFLEFAENGGFRV